MKTILMAIAVLGFASSTASAVDIKPQILSASAQMVRDKPEDLRIAARVAFGDPGYKSLRIVTNRISGNTLEMNVIATERDGFFPQVVTEDRVVRTLIDFRTRHPRVSKVKLIGGNGSSITVNIPR